MTFQNKHCISYNPQWWKREQPAIKPIIINKEKYLLVKIVFHRNNEWVVFFAIMHLHCTTVDPHGLALSE